MAVCLGVSRRLIRMLENRVGLLFSPCLKCRSIGTSSRHRGFNLPALMRRSDCLPPGSHSKTFCRARITDTSQTGLSSVVPVFALMKFEKDGNITSYEKKKTELYQELNLQARDLRFQHLTSITTRNNRIIVRMEFLKAVISPDYLLILDYRNVGLESWLLRDLGAQLAGDGQLLTSSLPFEFRSIEAILLHRVNTLQARLNNLQPQILEMLESLVDPKLLSVDRSKLHILLQNSKSLSELETDIKVFKETLLKILDEEELIEEMCLAKCGDTEVNQGSSFGIDHAEEMELLLENYYRQAEDLANTARELKLLIDDSESIVFINLDRSSLWHEFGILIGRGP
ncbi:magnesium transporter MRS2 homolog, mitochondrial isoform X3 [Polypterus senegalus]|uniref:magnesium transporter MRS2 homolog, mitochondrial isoform X3 n=1 Tax=Polypterus senegalus TaxID=55291 RepID=UPI0019635EAD|nr:magnesium transporter MRS2 homolog, mitochondrial isoform X3 [Polypterus senegalus]